MKTIGIITIHKINNYGSVFQAYSLQKKCEELGYETKIIDYDFPNDYHFKLLTSHKSERKTLKQKLIKLVYAFKLLKQHKKIRNFVSRYQNLTANYKNFEELCDMKENFDILVTGSDQLWNPKHCYADPAFFLEFSGDSSKKISYAASLGCNTLSDENKSKYKLFLEKYSAISVREESGIELITSFLPNKSVEAVLDPTLLLNKLEWLNEFEVKGTKNEKYILCYYLNYSFDAFPYADNLAEYISKITGYKVVMFGRPPQKITNKFKYIVDASPEDFINILNNAALVLTTSFHGTAFALNFSIPLYSIIESKKSGDSRQYNILSSVGLENRILELGEDFPKKEEIFYDTHESEAKLNKLRDDSLSYLKRALEV